MDTKGTLYGRQEYTTETLHGRVQGAGVGDESDRLVGLPAAVDPEPFREFSQDLQLGDRHLSLGGGDDWQSWHALGTRPCFRTKVVDRPVEKRLYCKDLENERP